MPSQPTDRKPTAAKSPAPVPAPKAESARTTPEPRDDSLLESIGKAVAAPVIDADKTLPDQGTAKGAPPATPPGKH